MTNTDQAKYRYAFLLLPNFTMVSFSSAVDALRMASRVSYTQTYSWEVLSPDDAPVTASNGLSIAPTLTLDKVKHFDTVFVCGGLNVRSTITPALLKTVRGLARSSAAMGGLCTGSYVLARAGLLNKYKATAHWEHLSALREECPQVEFSQKVFVIDRDRLTASGGIAPLDLMQALITQHLGIEVATSVADQFNMERVRNDQDEQHVPLKTKIGAYHRTLLRVAALMEATIEEPMSLTQLSNKVGVSRRQVERLFKHYLGSVPTKFYLDLRLRRARDLLLQTNMSIIDITIACGFRSPPHFSKCYRSHFGYPPSHERRIGAMMLN